MTPRRSATCAGVVLAAAVLLAGCGTERAGRTPRAAAPSSPEAVPCAELSVRPSERPSQPADAGDGNPKYAENHAFQVPTRLTGQAVCDAAEAEQRVRKALSPYARDRGVTGGQVRTALRELGYRADQVTVTGAAGYVTYLVDLGPVCVEGSVSGTVDVETHGVYAEGTGCVKPQGGH
ncbi:hypothetical protein ACIBL6_37135 [Streptomyces sp. NPDC050400]|uniref:hypothetical protein n=1 Tax=Streptomyces sp. NPDC050400 TaxID=3365610 RepID=UPI0037900CA4